MAPECWEIGTLVARLAERKPVERDRREENSELYRKAGESSCPEVRG